MSKTHEFKTHEFKVGEYGEGYPWKIVEDVEETDQWNHVKPCPHAHSFGSKEDRDLCTGELLGVSKTWIVPAVVVAYNEGHCNGTAVCLDCILEAAAKIRGKKA